MSSPSVGSGNVTVKILDEEYNLVPNLRAAKAISQKHGGGMGAIQKIGAMDIDTIVDIIASGLSLTPNGIKKFADETGLEEAVWKTGVFELSAACIRYVHILLNGGRAPSAEDEKGDDPLETNNG